MAQCPQTTKEKEKFVKEGTNKTKKKTSQKEWQQNSSNQKLPFFKGVLLKGSQDNQDP